MEKWDLYNRNFEKLDKIHYRGEKLQEGEYHLVGECLVRHLDGSYLLMKRHPNKKMFPLCYEATAGGSALCGESPLECIKRELHEETGIVSNDFRLINQSINDSNHTIYFTYLCYTDCDKNSVSIQENETIGYKWINEEEFKEFVKSDECVTTQIKRLNKYFDTFLIGSTFEVIVDRTLGSTHPKYPDIVYPLNYGYIPNIIGGDNEEQDAYVLTSLNTPLKTYKGKLIGVVIRVDDNETKWIISNEDFSEKQILEKINFQEKYFRHVLFK